MSESLTFQTLTRAFYDRMYGRFLPKLEVNPNSRKRLGALAKAFLGSDDTPSGKIFVFKGVEVKDNPDVPEGKLRVDREWADADVEFWAITRGEDLLKWKLPPTDFDLPEAA